MTRNYRNPRGLPYSPPDADSYTYVDGRGFAPTPPVITERRLLQWCANGIGFSILFYIIFSFTLPGVVLGIFQIFNPYMHIYSDGTVLSPLIMEIVELISGNLSLLLPFLLLVFVHRAPFQDILPFQPFRASITLPSLFIALAVSVIGYVASTMVSAFLSLFGVMPVMADFSFPEEPAAAFLFLLNITLIAPLTEEIVFRGVIMNILRRFGDCFALLISSLLFAFVHMNLVQMPNAFIMGLVIGYFTLCSGSLWTGVCIHVLNNSLVLLLNGVLTGLSEDTQLLVMLAVYGAYLFLGLIALLMLLKHHPNMFYIRRSSTLSTERKKYSTFFSSLTMVICLLILGLFTISNIAPL